ncbi:hypothetical protein C4565_02610 [Candidatus Parcubacteria bacterium]|jgi:hypothetical protein|nr:MAG: hypothetical protein C4565_02610 [Candidatus Parcubacteria bacterium]
MPGKIEIKGEKALILFRIPKKYLSDIWEYINKNLQGSERVSFGVHYNDSDIVNEEARVDAEHKDKFYQLLEGFAKEKDILPDFYNPHIKSRFGDLEENDFFIIFPDPGDNSGHGGYLGTHNIFQKVSNPEHGSSNTVADNAVRIQDDVYSHIPDGMAVIKIR